MLPLLLALFAAPPKNVPAGELTVERWLSGEFSEQGPRDFGEWRPDGRMVVRLQAPESEPTGFEVVLVDPSIGKARVIIPSKTFRVPGRRTPLHPERVSLSEDGKHALIFTDSQKVWRQNTRGDFWDWDAATGKLLRLGEDAPAASLMFAKLSPDGTRAGYVYRNNLYVEDLATRRITSLTHDGTDRLINGTSDWVYEEELDIRDGWRWSPDGKRIAYWQVDSTPEPIYPLVDDTGALYPTIKTFPYPVAGQANPTVRVGVVAASGGPTRWMADVANSANGYIARMQWADNSSELLLQHLNRRQNELRYLLANAQTGAVRTCFVDRDPAWVDVVDTDDHAARWVDGGRSFLVLSEQDGWRHLYAVPRDGSVPHLLTPDWSDVDQVVGADESSGLVYYTASPGNPVQRYLFVADANGATGPRRLTPADDTGTNDYDVAPTGKLALHTRSRFGEPSAHELVRLPDHSTVRGLGDNAELKRRLAALRLGTTSLIQLDADDGEKMDTSLICPPNFDPARKYPVLFHVYGEPAGTTVNDRWDGDDTFERIIAQHGYIVVSVDNRGTPSLKGRAWRKSIYRKIGVVASADQAAAARQIARLPYVDPSRIAIWGWSGGGSMTLNMLFRYPDIYRLGMAVAPVPDIRLYDTIYQERYMGLPQSNPADYAASSPITFAKQLKSSLLLVHGSGDDNVHYAGTERLVNLLVSLNKPFQLMVYPNRTHAIVEGPGTSRHLYELLLRYLLTNMPPN